MTWYDIIGTISKLIELDEFTVEICANAMGCKFEPIDSNRYRSDALQAPFEYGELISGSDKTTLLLTLRVDAPREEFAMRMLSLGKPIDIYMISPPIADESGTGTNMDWERKYSLCYEIGDRPVWFGIEEANSKKRLVNISIPQPENTPRDNSTPYWKYCGSA